MGVNWNDKYKENQLNALILEGCNLSLSTATLGIHSVISSALSFHKDISEYDASNMVAQALTDIRNKEIQQSEFLNKINQLQKSYLRKQKKIFHVATSLSFQCETRIRSIKHDDVEIVFLKKFPSKYNRKGFIENNLTNINSILQNPQIPSNYYPIIIKSKCRNPREAMKKAEDSLNFILGIWNYFLNIQKGPTTFFASVKETPINKIVKGPIYTIHLENGNIAQKNLYFYESDYYGPLPCHPLTSEINNIKKFEGFIKRRISKKPKWAAIIKDSFVRYNRALEYYSCKQSFIELWSILEHLTSTTKETNYDTTIRRVSNIYANEQELYEGLLNFIRIRRNSLVHLGEFREHGMNITHQLKKYVEQMLEYHIIAIKLFSNLGEALEFLDLPSDQNKIKSRLKILKMFYKNRFSD